MTVTAVRTAVEDPLLVHDYLLVRRGAERTFAAIAACWPRAPIATLLYDEQALGDVFAGHAIRTSPLQRLGARQANFRALLPLFPAAASRLPVGGHDVVISSSSAFAHGVRPDPGAVHVCYCYTPFRYAWYERDRAAAEAPAVLRPALAGLLAGIRRWDLRAAGRVTRYIAISEISQRRIEETYGRFAPVVHPPVETHRFEPGTPEDFLLVVTELVRHKRVDVALEAARQAGLPIRVVGVGPDLARLQALYGDCAEFLGRLDDLALAELYPRALALVVPNVEEFGIAAVEAQAAGRPVVAIDAGGVRETIRDGVTGLLVRGDDAGALADALSAGDLTRFDSDACVAQAARFSVEAFQERLVAEVAAAVRDGPESDLR